MKGFLRAIYLLFRAFVFILFVLLWGSAFIQFVGEGDIGGAVLWILVGTMFYFIIFRLFLRNPNKKQGCSYRSHSSRGDSFDSFWDSSDSGGSSDGGGDGGGGD